jgi:transposase-like protein
VRIRRKFSDKFKRAAVQRLASASVSEVARECGVSVSVLHRWHKQIGGQRAASRHPGQGRREFSKEFKESVAKRLESGESMRDAVCAFGIAPTVMRRWWHEWRKYGDAAFSGYGKSRSPAASSRTVIVRFTADEYESIKAASLAREANSLPDFVRGQILHARRGPSVAEIAGRLKTLLTRIQKAAGVQKAVQDR